MGLFEESLRRALSERDAAIHLSLGTINLDTAPLWTGKKLKLLKYTVSFDKAQEREIYTYIFQPTSILSVFMHPLSDRGSQFTSGKPLPHHIHSHSRPASVIHTSRPTCLRTAQLMTLCLTDLPCVDSTFTDKTFFPLSGITFLPFKVLVVENLTYFEQK